MSKNEIEAAKEYWHDNHDQALRIIKPGEGEDFRFDLINRIVKHHPKSVLEFGCGSARNLVLLYRFYEKTSKHKISITGVDLKEHMVSRTRDMWGDIINLVVGDEKWLAYQDIDSFDVVFTSSVLDHVPSPLWKEIYANLVRVAKKAVILYEPVLPKRGRPKNGARETILEGDFNEHIDTTPFTYSWDYLKNDPELKEIAKIPIPDNKSLGKYYRLFERAK